ncbi:MAG: DUF2283 domain-containing protein [Candidatus Micrarchaeaceae archaeon]
MRYNYDRKTDILVLILGKGRLDFGEQKENIITHYDKSGKPLEIEILNASKTALEIVNAIVGNRKRIAAVST